MVLEDYEHPVAFESIDNTAYHIFGTKENTPSEETVVRKIREYTTRVSFESGVAIALLYLTGSRIEEITKHEYVGIAKDDIDIKLPAITCSNISLQEKPSNKEPTKLVTWMIIKTRIEKRFTPQTDMSLEERRRQLDKIEYKVMKLPMIPSHPLFPLVELVGMRMEQIIGDPKDINDFNMLTLKYKDVELYDKSSRNLRKIIRRYFNLYPHLFRHFRCKHLVENYGYSTSALVKLIGWKQANMALTYTETNEGEIEDREMLRADERNI